MVELEKNVKDLNLEQNPLPVLPDKWHLRFGLEAHATRPAGYTSNEVCVALVFLGLRRCDTSHPEGQERIWNTPGRNCFVDVGVLRLWHGS